jgi:hypothetical protein
LHTIILKKDLPPMSSIFRITDNNLQLHTVAFLTNVANAAGGVSAPVTTTVNFVGAFSAPALPANGYACNVTPSQAILSRSPGPTFFSAPTSAFPLFLTPPIKKRAIRPAAL